MKDAPFLFERKPLPFDQMSGTQHTEHSVTGQEPSVESPDTTRDKDTQEDLPLRDINDSERIISPYPSYTTTKVEKEVLATLQYYLETYPEHEGTSSPTEPLFCHRP